MIPVAGRLQSSLHPQVHGRRGRDALRVCGKDFGNRERGRDLHPLVFPESGDVISGGNFHGAPLALALDFAAIALTDLMSHQRTANRAPA